MKEPRLAPVVNGWAAYGNGWAVHGKTEEEALRLFREAQEKHKQIDALPYTFDLTLLDTQFDRSERPRKTSGRS